MGGMCGGTITLTAPKIKTKIWVVESEFWAFFYWGLKCENTEISMLTKCFNLTVELSNITFQFLWIVNVICCWVATVVSPLCQAGSLKFCQVLCPNSPETHTNTYTKGEHSHTHTCRHVPFLSPLFSAVSPSIQHLAPPGGHTGQLSYQTPPSINADSYFKCVCVCVLC